MAEYILLCIQSPVGWDNKTMRPPYNLESSFQLRPFEQLALLLFGIGVIFASLGLGEAVYRILSLQFDGATDRLPPEMLAGLASAWIATKLFRTVCERRMETRRRMKLIQDRDDKIRHALQALVPVSLQGHQQAIRVIREEVEHIHYVLSDPLVTEGKRLRELWSINTCVGQVDRSMWAWGDVGRLIRDQLPVFPNCP